jgi:hypothetical protein
LEVNKQDGYYQFLIFSSRNVALEGNSGELVSVAIEAATDAEAGTYEANPTFTVKKKFYCLSTI